jgi:hypothetical protein
VPGKSFFCNKKKVHPIVLKQEISLQNAKEKNIQNKAPFGTLYRAILQHTVPVPHNHIYVSAFLEQQVT